MKFDPFSWQEVKPNEKIEFGKGVLRLRCSAPAPLYIEADGFEVLAGIGATFDLELAQEVTFHVDAPEGVRVFYHRPVQTTFAAEGEVFTNIDRMPDESGSVMEVRRALRQLELERRAALREIRQAREAVAASIMPADDAVIEPETAPEPDPVKE